MQVSLEEKRKPMTYENRFCRIMLCLGCLVRMSSKNSEKKNCDGLVLCTCDDYLDF